MNREETSTKMQIVNKAVELFKEYGFQNVSVSTICESVGITRSAFYYYFKTKDEIFDYYLLTPELYIMENIIPVLKASNYRSQFIMIFELFLQRIAEVGPEITGFVFKRNIDASVQNIAPQDITMWKTYVSLIKNAKELGEINNKMDAESIVETIIHLINGIGIVWCNKKGSFDYVQECRRKIENII